jgi:nitrate reductase gamma subunit
MFIFHVAVSMTLMLLLTFTKIAHAIYRVVALYIRALKPVAAGNGSRRCLTANESTARSTSGR